MIVDKNLCVYKFWKNFSMSVGFWIRIAAEMKCRPA